MKPSDIFERISSHPGVTVRTHCVVENRSEIPFIRRGKHEALGEEKVARMRELDKMDMSRREMARIIGCSDTTIWHYLGPKYKKQRAPNKRRAPK